LYCQPAAGLSSLQAGCEERIMMLPQVQAALLYTKLQWLAMLLCLDIDMYFTWTLFGLTGT
jgi:hypothetical protein